MKFTSLSAFFILTLMSNSLKAQFTLKEIPKEYTVRIRAYDKESQEELEGTYVRLFNLTTQTLTDSAVVSNGFATFKLKKGYDYDIVGQRSHYLTRRANFNAACYLKDPKKVFTSTGKAPKNTNQAYRFVAFGDIGAGTPDQKSAAYQAYIAKPDFVTVAGDVVYERGLISEYDTRFWPIYNATKADTVGVPMMSTTPFIAAVGNHDTDTRDLDKFPDALAYYLFWNQPLNGPLQAEGSASVPKMIASEANRKAFIDAAGNNYPRMANFSFDYGNAHWTVIDSNPYVDWTDTLLVNWVEKDLAASKDATWHFVMFHHPGFNSSKEHFEQQQMRLLSPIFDKAKVDIVFNGHVHNYQRTFPMTFVPDKKGVLLVGGMGMKNIRGRVVNGTWKLDKAFDGKTKTKPEGVIYLVTGAGGQELYNPEQNNDPDSWQKFTDKFISLAHSISVVDVDGKTLTVRQVGSNGQELDSFKITK
jgi:predicted phosphodiesterase